MGACSLAITTHEVTEVKDSYAYWAEMRCRALIYTRACKGLAQIVYIA